MLAGRPHPLTVCPLSAQEVPQLALSVQASSDEPFGGIPTLAYAKLFERARADGVIVLLDGQGMDEQWAGYDYYASATADAVRRAGGAASGAGDVQGAAHGRASRLLSCRSSAPAPSRSARRGRSPTRCATCSIATCSARSSSARCASTIASRCARRSSCANRSSIIACSSSRSGSPSTQDRGRRPASGCCGTSPRSCSRRARRWRRSGRCRRRSASGWRDRCATGRTRRSSDGLARVNWLDAAAVRRQWELYCAGASDNSFYVWQWISLGLMHAVRGVPCASV